MAAEDDDAFSLAALAAPLAPDAPCGPDLDLEGDAAYMNFMAAGEGVVPATFYSPHDGRPFDRAQADFPAQYAALKPLLARTRDLRLVVLLAKFRILDRDLAGFVTAAQALAALCATQWEAVHPRGEDGDFLLRMAALQSLDDMAPVILPLQYAPLFEHKRFGTVSFRLHLLAEGEAQPRGEEERPDPAALRRAFEETDLDALRRRRDELGLLVDALRSMREAFVSHVGAAEAVAFPRLAPLADAMRALLQAQVALRDPAAAPPADDAPPETGAADGAPTAALPAGDVKDFRAAAAALRAASAYYMRREPSNPALLLVRQAQELIGKSFLDALRVLAPDYVDEAKLSIGRAHMFELPVARLADFAAIEDAPEDDGEPPSFAVDTREAALALLAKVGAFYQQAEPSSPIAYLVERARAVTGRDFLSLLKDMLPPDTLRTPDGGR
ncbi:ImpA family type VI secretion system protein [Methylocella sp.]|uniref:ImpA family type VI secretion system protein n=1 Tax=Methylocella sp. TaxID=1978226 RepID=UPI0037844F0A